MSFEQARYNMVVQQIRPWYVWDERVLDAMQEIPREHFVPAEFGRLAYSDMAIPLSHHETMLPPKVVARALDNLKIEENSSVLEIGTGTGYITAILLKLCRQVVSIEIEDEFYQLAQTHLANTPHKGLTLEKGDGVNGFAQAGPYDAIFVTGSYPMGVPGSICKQLKEGGRIFAICGEGVNGQAVLITKHGNHFDTKILFECEAPTLKNAQHNTTFQF